MHNARQCQLLHNTQVHASDAGLQATSLLAYCMAQFSCRAQLCQREAAQSVCLSVCLSVTNWYHVITSADWITRFSRPGRLAQCFETKLHTVSQMEHPSRGLRTSAGVDRSRHKGLSHLSAVVDIQGVSAATCSSRRQKSPRQNYSQIVKYKNIFSSRQKNRKKLFSTKRDKNANSSSVAWACEQLRHSSTARGCLL